MAEIAEMLSFPELFLILRRDANRKTADFRLMAIAQILAASAPWSKDASKRANDFISALDDPETVEPEQSTGELTRMLMHAGIPVRRE